MSSIFISYRRSDAPGHARNLHHRLSQVYGEETIFFDRGSIESVDLPEEIDRALESAKVLLALIGPDWLAAMDSNGERRLGDPKDFVRREITRALERGIRVIPILFDDVPMPDAGALPDPLRALSDKDAHRQSGKTYEFDRQLQKLAELLDAVEGMRQIRLQGMAPGGSTFALVGLPPETILDRLEASARREGAAQARAKIDDLKERLGVTQEALASFFHIVQEKRVPLEKLTETLEDIARRHKEVLSRLAVFEAEDPEIKALIEQARQAAERSDYDTADNLLDQAESAELEAVRKAEEMADRAAEAARKREIGVRLEWH